jgi:hypothetical protein
MISIILLLFLSAEVYAYETYYVSQQATRKPRGNDSHTCEQAKNPATSRASINAGLQCLSSGDTLIIGPGTYNELLISQQSNSRACSSGDSAVQQPCYPIVNGIDPDQPTKLIAAGNAVLSPAGKQFPGGGSAITLLDYARFIHVEGLRIVRHSNAGSVGGVYIGNAQHVTITRNELADGQIKGGSTSKYLTITHNYIHHTGLKECPHSDNKPTPSGCPHGMYVCGTDQIISDNRVEYCSYYGIHVSCEGGGISRIKIERNIVRHNSSVGIRCAGSDCTVASNLLEHNGSGITLSGSGLIANNTIHGWKEAGWNDDPTGIWTTSGDGSGFTVVNNLITEQKNAYLSLGNSAGVSPNPDKNHHNMSDKSGNTGITLIAPVENIYTDSASGDLTLKSNSPAIRAGITVAVESDVQGQPYTQPPDLGAYVFGTTPLPEPPPSGDLILNCAGELGAKGVITMICSKVN